MLQQARVLVLLVLQTPIPELVKALALLVPWAHILNKLKVPALLVLQVFLVLEALLKQSALTEYHTHWLMLALVFCVVFVLLGLSNLHYAIPHRTRNVSLVRA